MTKKLFIVLLLIAATMLAIAGLTGDQRSGKKETKTPVTLSEMVGKPAPDFSLVSYDKKIFDLSQQQGKKVILFFNEGIMCYPACWNQMAALGTDSRLNNEGVISASVVVDGAKEWDRAIQQMPELGKGRVLLDSTKEVSRQYGMLSLESSMHKGSMPGHTYLIIDERGVVRYTLDDPKMSIQNDTLAEELTKL
ncbi:hypothetical protein A2884_02165 [Candidatus Saccharibacteria bacterium RIFCSPHIGHO2_01_FULL_48_12]|nr:MAG: hypothetical protein A2884_02165 [Candidatus Saccharibacteria bacterium RIFCSPHIGHO2_01_FULL_48_12]OGL34954.1 MAG: hypothetical protein A3F38_02420 [Candidatus Saccharibacteria bacterium RIFCSPHIGHO2_12_FULL_48_21]